MGWVMPATQQSCSVLSTPCLPTVIRSSVTRPSSRDGALFPSNLKPVSSGLLKHPRISLRCNSTGDSGGNEFRTVLDAFFLGKAVGEALTLRIESSVGEFLSIIGRLQAEQQKLVLEFQEEVLEKAGQAKELASREVMVAKGLLSKTASLGISTVKDVSVSDTASSVADSAMSAASSSVSAVKGVSDTASAMADSAMSAASSTVSTVKGVSDTASTVADSAISGASSSMPKPADDDDPFFGFLSKN